MIRQTSIDAYNEIVSNGLLGERQFSVYKMLFEFGPLTSYELTRKFKENNWLSELGGIHQRLSELERKNVVKLVGKKVNQETGKNNILWDVTDRLPIKLEKSKRTKCKHCNGKGYYEHQQARLF